LPWIEFYKTAAQTDFAVFVVVDYGDAEVIPADAARSHEAIQDGQPEAAATATQQVVDAVRHFLVVVLVGALMIWLTPRAYAAIKTTLRQQPLPSAGWGIVAVLGFVVLFYLTDRPAKAHWLEPREREWLIAEAPETYYVTDYYRRYPLVLVRLSRIDGDALRDVLDPKLRER
jgi:hypothetical protein